MSGYYRMYRGWLDHPAFADEPYSRHAAWAWLIDHAVWKPERVGIGSKTISIERGQLCHSLRFMAKAWKWDEARVRRFIARIVREKMIVCVTDAGHTVITICNYNKYQVDSSVTDAATDAAATQQRRVDDAESKNIRREEGKKESESSDIGFAKWWAAVPKRVGKGQAERAYRTALKQATAQELFDGAVRWAKACAEKDPRYIKHPSTWLNGKCWLDEVPQRDNVVWLDADLAARRLAEATDENIGEATRDYYRAIGLNLGL